MEEEEMKLSELVSFISKARLVKVSCQLRLHRKLSRDITGTLKLLVSINRA